MQHCTITVDPLVVHALGLAHSHWLSLGATAGANGGVMSGGGCGGVALTGCAAFDELPS